MSLTMLIIFILYTLLNRCSSEPQCSKFHYEEKLLEKMIRLEISVATMKKEIEDSQKKVATSLYDLQEERKTWEETLHFMFERSADDLRNMITVTKAKVQEELNLLESKQLDSKLKESVAFSAQFPKDTALSSGLIMVFKAVLFNEGAAYNEENGIFTVPHSGVYIFSVQFCVEPGKNIDFAFMANDKVFKQARINKHSTSYFSCNNFDAVTLVRVNDEVKIKITNCSSGKILYESLNYHWNMFSGCLVYKI